MEMFSIESAEPRGNKQRKTVVKYCSHCEVNPGTSDFHILPATA